MVKVERNEECPCLSGKKYKRCCSNNKEMVDFFLTNLNAQYIDSNYMINELSNSSSLLKSYIYEKLMIIQKPIIWLVNPKLDANMRSISLEDQYGIIIKKIPVDSTDHFDLAHELGHLVFAEQGYPGACARDNDRRKMYLCATLTNSIMDPKVNELVIAGGFDFSSYIKKAIGIQIPMISKYPNEESLHVYNRHFLKCLLIEKIQEWAHLPGIENPFNDLYIDRFPHIYAEAKEFIDVIKSVGTDTPEKTRYLLSKLIKENKMTETIDLQ